MAKRNEIFEEISQLNEKLYILIKELEEIIAEEKEYIDEVNELYRILHTLKSLMLMADLAKLSDIIHLSEQMLNEIKKGKINLNSNVMETIFNVHTLINQALSKKTISEKKLKQAINKIKKILSEQKEITKEDLNFYLSKLPEDLIQSFTDTEINRVYLNIKKGRNIILCSLTLNFENFEKEIEEITTKLKENGEVIAVIPGDLLNNNTKINFDIVYSSETLLREIKKNCGKNAKLKILYKQITKKNANLENKEKTKISPILKIESNLIDSLLGDIDELESAKNNLIKKTKEVTEEYQFEKLEFYISLLNKKISNLHKNIVNLRLVNLWPLFQLIENTIKTTAEQLDKKVNVEIRGANEKIDKPIIDILIDPLVHLARNAIDHGIEYPDERIKKGKNEYGKITINAYQSENSVYIEFTDDGKGIDLDKVKEKAKQLGLNKFYHEFTEELLLQLIFQPGFSTKEHSSKISGRGIGLDSVKATLTSIGGDIFIKTEKEKGTTFILKLPLTTAIMPLFFATVDDFIICIPEFAIINIEEFNEEKMIYLNNKTYYKCENSPVPLISLPQLMNKSTIYSNLSNIITLNFASTTICVLVDKIIDYQEKTIMPFKGKLKKFPIFSGVCRYDDNKIGFILDVNQLIELTRKKYETRIKFTTFNF
ncbi:two-component system, chemotaxis family, sensor kinase CheA [Thermotomaculum hydrothermale]|uniref:histidine kinase n=1 Tax=Thermotomaculum hydrothermale TaxID=981385 RepID=A0A7R6SY29_9BACT|nr:ATP-binding protein [Thermotomaculum hydrothermale]BBB32200.1 two-component system, chemotaxis family, sensor kinase CheA [Thermotomaculum hydrothermale]